MRNTFAVTAYRAMTEYFFGSDFAHDLTVTVAMACGRQFRLP